MRLINSDGQITDARVLAEAGGSANRNTATVIDNGKYIAAVAICAAICGLCAAQSWSIYQDSRNIGNDLQDEYQKTRNHTIELEARLKVLADEVQEMKHERR